MYDIRDPYNNDDEDEKARILRQLLGADAPDTAKSPDGPRAVPMSADDFPTPDSGPEPRVSTLGRDETSPMKQPQQQQAGGSDSGDGFDWQLLAGLVLDAGMNHGRGLGQMIGAYANNREAYARAKEQHKLRLEEIAARKGDTDFDHWYKQQLIEGAEKDRKLRGERETDLQGRFQTNLSEKQSPDSKTNTTKVEVAERVAGAGVEGREKKKQELADVIEGNVAGVTRARTDASTDAKNENPAELTKAERERLARDDQRLDLEKQRLTEAERARQVAEDARRQQIEDREADAFRVKNKDALVAMKNARTLQNAFKAQPGDVRGLGMYQREAPAWFPGITPEDIHQRQVFQQLVNPEVKELFGSGVSAGEQARANKSFATSWNSTEAEQIAAVNEIADMLTSQLKGAGKGKEAVARRIAEEYGLADLFPDTTPAAAAAAVPQLRASDPMSGAVELPLPKPLKKNVPLQQGPDEEELRKRFGVVF